MTYLKRSELDWRYPGCSLCMGNQRELLITPLCSPLPRAILTTEWVRMRKVYLGSAELAAVVSILGRIPSNEEYFSKLDGIM